MSRHTQPMTDAYMTGQRMRNAARTQCKIEQLGDRWLLHPDNNLDAVEVLAQRRAKAMRENRLLIVSTPDSENGYSAFRALWERVGFSPVKDAFNRHIHKFDEPIWKTAPAGHGASDALLIQYLPSSEGGAQ